MIEKRVLVAERVRRIAGSFAFIEHRFLRGGFWRDLGQYELLLYFFLIMVSDRQGLSYYSYDKICSMHFLHIDEYIQARDILLSIRETLRRKNISFLKFLVARQSNLDIFLKDR